LIDVDGASGTSGFARSALMSVQLTSGTGSTIDGGVTLTHKDATDTLVLGKDGKASYGGTVDYTHYLLNGINDKASVSGIIADAGDALNGITVQDSNTEKFIFPLGEIFEFVTRFTTLEPGDILTTGTPEGVGAMVDGDVVEITIDGIGTLSNTVRDEK
jgi:hypothetical protein